LETHPDVRLKEVGSLGGELGGNVLSSEGGGFISCIYTPETTNEHTVSCTSSVKVNIIIII
jgi:hypothetical protein